MEQAEKWLEPDGTNKPREEGRLQDEADRLYEAMVSGKLDDKTYCYMYAAKQALGWAMDPNSARSPFDTIVAGKVMPLPRADTHPN